MAKNNLSLENSQRRCNQTYIPTHFFPNLIKTLKEYLTLSNITSYGALQEKLVELQNVYVND